MTEFITKCGKSLGEELTGTAAVTGISTGVSLGEFVGIGGMVAPATGTRNGGMIGMVEKIAGWLFR